jgi:histidinol-phosphatase (PHP family)
MHTHTVYCDGKNTVEEMVKAAIDAGLKTIGFSGHFILNIEPPQDWSMDEARVAAYRADIIKVREQYKDKINILLGCEKDYFSPEPKDEYDYSIGSVHYVYKDGIYVAMDLAPEELLGYVDTLYGGDSIAMAKDYYSLVADVHKKTGGEIVGHFDLLTKFNEKYSFLDTDSKAYRSAALEAADALLENKELVYEINTGAMSRGWRTTPYPADFILKYLVEKKGRIILTGDSHAAESITYGYKDAVEYARSCGVKELWTVKSGKEFTPVKI